MDPNLQIVQSLKSPNSLITKDGSFYDHKNLQEVEIFILYFSAHWCPPCRQFTPILAEQFRQHQSKKSMIIFVSGDRSRQEQLNYMSESHGNWPAIPCQSPLQNQLNAFFQVRGIPSVIVIKASNGEIISREGRQEIMQSGSLAFVQWEQSCVHIDTSIVNTLLDNPEESKKNAIEILLRLIGNILRDPQNIKFRRIRLSNPKIESMLLTANGAFEALFSMGFEEDTDALILPLSASLEVVKAFKGAIENLPIGEAKKDSLDEKKVNENEGKSPLDVICNGDVCLNISNERPLMKFDRYEYIRGNIANVVAKNDNERRFVNTLLMEHQVCLAREDKEAHEKVFQVVPIKSIEAKVKAKFKLLFQDDASIDLKTMRDLAVYELVDWFKSSFFKWVDKLKCDKCQVEMASSGLADPNAGEIQDGANRVETYICQICFATQRFPRYGQVPAKLLETRRGRCGEWANCFALILRAFGFLTRHVNDFADHVWCEFFSESEQRWKHVDPCEGLVDKPKVYDHGWKKKLGYVLATSVFEVQDVTKRYVMDHEALKSRRQLVSEDWLNKLLMDQTDAWQGNLKDDNLKTKLAKMRLTELAELMFSKSELSEEEAQGRQSGSLSWRLARRETSLDSNRQAFVIKPTKDEIENETIDVSFNIVDDVYVRSSNAKENGWKSWTFSFENVFRKEENDWKMVYLARQDGSKNGKISWKIDLGENKKVVKSVELLVQSKVFENGKVTWQLQGDSKTLLPTSGIRLVSEELRGSKTLTLQGILSGGKGEVGWQHAQLFRTSMEDKTASEQFRFIIRLKPE